MEITEEEEKRTEELLEKIIAEYFPTFRIWFFKKSIHPKAQWTLSSINTKRATQAQHSKYFESQTT